MSKDYDELVITPEIRQRQIEIVERIGTAIQIAMDAAAAQHVDMKANKLLWHATMTSACAGYIVGLMEHVEPHQRLRFFMSLATQVETALSKKEGHEDATQSKAKH